MVQLGLCWRCLRPLPPFYGSFISYPETPWCRAFSVLFCFVFSRVDAVDFHDPGEEEDGDYDLIEDPVTEEKYK